MTNIEAVFMNLTGTLASSRFAAASYAGLSDDELVRAHETITSHVHEATKQAALSAAEIARRSTRDLGQSGLAWRKGHLSPESMLQKIGRGSKGEARRLVAVGTMMAESEAATELNRQNAEHPEWAVPVETPWHVGLGDAVALGRLGIDAANSIRQGLGEPALGVAPELLRDALGVLIEQCVNLNADQAFKAARQARDLIDADRIAARAEAKRARQYLRMYLKPDGMYHGDFELDPENGLLLKDAIDQVTSPRRGGPRFVEKNTKAWAKGVADDARGTDWIAAEALVEMIRIAAAADPGTVFGGTRPAVRVIVYQSTLDNRNGHGRLEGHPDPVPLETVDRHLCDTGFTPIAFDDDGQCVNVGRDQRLFTARQRTGLSIRDGGCLWPDCDRPPSWTEAHHIDPWAAALGRTDIAQGVLLCRRHHLLLHNRHWEVVRRGGAEYWLIPPREEDRAQKPIPLPSKASVKLDSPITLQAPLRRFASGRAQTG